MPASRQAGTTVTTPPATRSMTCLRTRARLSAGAIGPTPPSKETSTDAVSLWLLFHVSQIAKVSALNLGSTA